MRNLSFALTTEQVRNRTKTVTRRKGSWWSTVLKTGTLLCAVEKSQGIEKGGLVRLCVIRVVDTSVERLDEIVWRTYSGKQDECAAEGFPGMSPIRFVNMFILHMGGDPNQKITRIEFEYTDEAVPA